MNRILRNLIAGATGVALLAAAAIAVGPRSLRAAEVPAEQPRTLSVQGRAIIEAPPDAARVSFGVNQLAPTAAEAYGKVADDANRILTALKGKGVAEKDIQTSGLSLQAEYQYDKGGVQHLRGYRASNNVTVTTRAMDGIGGLIDAAVAAGANNVQGIQFFVYDTEALVRGALDRAVDDAREKADRVAARLGSAITGVQRVHVTDEGGSVPPPMAMAEGGFAREAAAPMPVMAGTSRLQVSVSVEFLLR